MNRQNSKTPGMKDDLIQPPRPNAGDTADISQRPRDDDGAMNAVIAATAAAGGIPASTVAAGLKRGKR